jgi:hypothetical protein
VGFLVFLGFNMKDLPQIDVDRKIKCKCNNPKPQMVNYSMMWHEADIICNNCGKFIRYWDAG